MRGRQRTVGALLLIALLAGACGRPAANLEQAATVALTALATATTVPAPTQAATSISAAATATVTLPAPPETASPTPAPRSPLWVAYHSSLFGFGLAVPCFWYVYPDAGTPSMLSYDEAFFRAHSVKGNWFGGQWPEGAIKVNPIVLEGADPRSTLTEAIHQLLDSDQQVVFATEEVTIGSNPAVVAELRSTQGADPPILLPVFRLSPERILFFEVAPQRALSSPDVQAIIASLALSPDQEIAFPSAPPFDPLPGRKVYLDEEAGICFAYPDTFEESEVRPGEFGLLGPGTGGEGQSRAGLTVQVQDLGPQGTLAGWVDAHSEDLIGALGSRQPFRLYGEPAELLAGGQDGEGRRVVVTVFGSKLYQLSFSLSRGAGQGVEDADLLFEVVTATFTFLPDAAWLSEAVPFYLVLPGDGGQSGPAVGCGDSVIAVRGDRRRTGSPVGDVAGALQELFSIRTETVSDGRYVHALYDADIAVQYVGVGGGEMMYVNLVGELPLVGSCADARMEAQILYTVYEHPGIDSLLITVNGTNMKQMFDASGTVGQSEPYLRSDLP